MSENIAIITTLVFGALLINKKLLLSKQWRATVTPLASIIGSGFLIIAPLLHSVFGKFALLGILVLVILGYGIGSITRFNIINIEKRSTDNLCNYIKFLEKSSQMVLGISYAISVAFYVSLFTSFLSKEMGVTGFQLMRWITTFALLGIMLISWFRGTRGLEKIELFSVTIKLAVIGGVLSALLVYDVSTQTEWFRHEPIKDLGVWDKLSMLAGMLMVTQGFETTRFMGAHYSPEIRVKAARNSQLIAIFIYILFIGLTCPIFLSFPIVELSETTVSVSLGKAISVLPLLLLGAAIASQLSAALADTIGGGGLLKEIIPSNSPLKSYYVAIIVFAIILIWSANVFEIINIASKGFASYFLLQTLIAINLLKKQQLTPKSLFAVIGSLSLVVILVFVIGFSTPAPHG